MVVNVLYLFACLLFACIQSYLLDTQVPAAGEEEEKEYQQLAAVEKSLEERRLKEKALIILPAQRTGVELKNVEIRYRTYTPEDREAFRKEQQTPLDASQQQKITAKAAPITEGNQIARDLEANEPAAATAATTAAARRPAFLLQPSIIDFSAHVKPGERIGIVGRTGAGGLSS